MKKSLLVIVGLVCLFFYYKNPQILNTVLKKETIPEINHDDSELIENAYQKNLSHIEVKGSGVVVKILKDDDVGSRHQRMILRLSNNRTVLIAHNIDLAPRIPHIQHGDIVYFKGEYVWNRQGGVIHWTHHDPKNKHEAGYLMHQNKTYQ